MTTSSLAPRREVPTFIMPSSDRLLSARDVIVEIVNNMREGIEPLLYSSLAPGLYHVVLHADDFERLSPIASRLADEAKRALDEELRQMNGGSRLTPGLLRRWLGKSPGIEPPQDGWVIRLQPDPDGELQPGHLAVMSELTLPPRQQFDGTETKRVTTVKRGDQTQTSRQSVPVQAASAQRTPHATLAYTDDEGPHTFAVDRDRVVIGRGGVGYWVDVKLRAAPDVSREHLRIRRDPATGAFFVKDLSSFGTTLDGVAIPKGVESADGTRRELDVEVPVPARARFVLAGLVTIDFERHGNSR
jgi:hypothetical protein